MRYEFRDDKLRKQIIYFGQFQEHFQISINLLQSLFLSIFSSKNVLSLRNFPVGSFQHQTFEGVFITFDECRSLIFNPRENQPSFFSIIVSKIINYFSFVPSFVYLCSTVQKLPDHKSLTAPLGTFGNPIYNQLRSQLKNLVAFLGDCELFLPLSITVAELCHQVFLCNNENGSILNHKSIINSNSILRKN